MKKRLLSILMALALCLTLLPTAALADGTYTVIYTDGVEMRRFLRTGAIVICQLEIKHLRSAAISNGPDMNSTDGVRQWRPR